MDSTTSYPPCISNESRSSLITTPVRDANATPITHADGTPLLSLAQSPPNPNSCVIIIQNNYIAEGGTINIFSSHCDGSTVVKFDHVASTAEPTFSNPPLARQPEPAAGHGRENIVLSGNTFGEYVMINVGSPNCTGAVKQTALASQDRNI